MTREICHSYRQVLECIAAGETIDVPDTLALHLDACPDCRRMFDRGEVPLAAESFEQLAPADRQRLLRILVGRSSPRWRRAALAAAVVGLAVLAAWLVPWPRPEGDTPPLVVALVEDHIRYLGRPERQSDLAAGALERELAAYVDFPVRLPSVTTAELSGARRCFLLGRRVALGFYRADDAELSYFVLPADGVTLPGEACSDRRFRCAPGRGYSVVAWERAGLIHAVVAADAGLALALAREAGGRPSPEPNRITVE